MLVYEEYMDCTICMEAASGLINVYVLHEGTCVTVAQEVNETLARKWARAAIEVKCWLPENEFYTPPDLYDREHAQ